MEYSQNNNIFNRFKLQKLITEWKTQEDKSFLKEVDKFALQNACKDLATAYNNYFAKRSAKPVFKSKKRNKNTYQTNFTNDNISFNDGFIKLPKLGYVKCSNNFRYSNNKIINVTVTRDFDNKYYASVIYEDNVLSLPKTNKSVGIDLGTRKLVSTSDGNFYYLPDNLNKLMKKIKREQRRLSRKVKDSSNYEKQRIKLAAAYRKRTNTVNNALHQVSYHLVKDYDYLYLEDLDLKQLFSVQDLKNKKNKLIASALGRLVILIKYKADMYDKQVHQIDRFFPSSKTCCKCNHVYMVRDKETYCCPYCGNTIDRDTNAAINILSYGLKMSSNKN